MTTMAAACLSVLLLSPGLQSGTDPATMMNDAIQMAHRGEHPRALALFRVIVTRDPRQLEARLWIAASPVDGRS